MPPIALLAFPKDHDFRLAFPGIIHQGRHKLLLLMLQLDFQIQRMVCRNMRWPPGFRGRPQAETCVICGTLLYA